MNLFANAWNHPKTTAAGLLIAVAEVAQVLSQHGVDLGKAGSGSVIALVGALATALLGMLSRDPAIASEAANATVNSTRKLGAVALIALLPIPITTGCSGKNVAQDIVNWTPALQGAVSTVDSSLALIAPADAAILAAATTGFNAASTLIANQAAAYLANPSASVLVQLQSQIVAFEQQVNTALLQTAKISNPASQKQAMTAVQGVGTIVSTILALVQSISTKPAVSKMAASSSIKISMVEPYLNTQQSARIVAAHYNELLPLAQEQVESSLRAMEAAGF